jgi:ComF family protein
MNIKKHFLPLIDIVLDIIYPRHCYICKKFIGNTSHQFLCYSCLHNLPLTRYEICQHCGKSLGKGIPSLKRCPRCKNWHFSFSSVRSSGLYEKNLRKLILDLKFKKQYHLHYVLGKILIRHLKKYPFAKPFDVVTPVPMYFFDEIQRGYNHSYLLAKMVAKEWNIPFIPNLLRQTKRKKQQSTLSAQERKKNILGVFTVSPDLAQNWQNKTVLLVDDVFTTGSTVQECTKVLKQAGILRVFVATVACSHYDT